MKRTFWIVYALLMLAGMAHGQTIVSPLLNGSWHRKAMTAKELGCDKYQHVSHWEGMCGPQKCSEDGGCLAVCMPAPPDHCEDNVVEVKERDWDALMERIKTLEDTVGMYGKMVAK